MGFIMVLLFFLGIICFHLDPSPRLFRKHKLYRKEWHKSSIGVPLREKIYYIRNLEDKKIVQELRKGVLYDLLGMSLIFITLLIFISMILINTGRI